MKRKGFVPPRRLHPTAPAQTAPASTAAVAVFDCVFTQRRGSADGSLRLTGVKAQVLDLQQREAAAGVLPAQTTAVLHAAHAAAMAAVAAGEPLGPLWQDGEPPPDLAVGKAHVLIEDDRGAAIGQEEWQLRQRIAAEVAAGRPGTSGADIPAHNIGRCAAPMPGSSSEGKLKGRGALSLEGQAVSHL